MADYVQLGSMRRADFQAALKLIRALELRPGFMALGPLLDAMEQDRPIRNPEPVASRKAPSVAAQLAPAVRTLYRPENDRREAVRDDEHSFGLDEVQL